MEKTGIITRSEFKNEWTHPKGGTLYFHNLELDNGDVGSCGTKTKEPDKLKEGSEINYTLTITERGNVIKLVQPQNNYQGGKSFNNNYRQEPVELKIAGVALSFAKDLIVAGKIELSDLEVYSDKCYNWIMSKKIVEISAPKEENKPISDETPKSEPEKWLNVTNGKDGDYTTEWLNTQAEIKLGRIKSVKDVRQIYKVSKAVQDKLEELFRFNQ